MSLVNDGREISLLPEKRPTYIVQNIKTLELIPYIYKYFLGLFLCGAVIVSKKKKRAWLVFIKLKESTF
jgi:hypothetical protein